MYNYTDIKVGLKKVMTSKNVFLIFISAYVPLLCLLSPINKTYVGSIFLFVPGNAGDVSFETGWLGARSVD